MTIGWFYKISGKTEGKGVMHNFIMGTSKNSNFVIPAQAGIQRFKIKCCFVSALHCLFYWLDTGLRRCDEFLRHPKV